MRIILLQRFEEPIKQLCTYVCELTESELVQLEDAIQWLKENASDYGGTLSEWNTLSVTPADEPECVGIQSVLAVMKRESRYDEIPDEPGAYYDGQQYAPFDAVEAAADPDLG